MTRRELIPDFKDSVYEGWAVNYLHNNFWRFQRTIGDWEDAISQSQMCFLDCRRRYGATAKNRKHFMSLFKMCMHSEFTDWANWQTKVESAEIVHAQLNHGLLVFSDGELTVKLRSSSRELVMVLNIILTGPAEVLAILRKDAKDAKKEVDRFFTNVVVYCGLPEAKAPILENELRSLLT